MENDEIKIEKRVRNRLESKFKKDKSNPVAKQLYKDQVKRVKRLITEKRNQFIHDTMRNKNSNTFWTIVKKLMNNKSQLSRIN